MDGHTRQTRDDAPCPKRLWVMTTLSDDEIVGPGGPLPQGLEFHVSRCPSCRALAQELRSVGASLGSAGEQEPPESLLRRAQRQTETALKDGARMTGRVDVGNDGAEVLGSPIPAWWQRRTTPLAAAAIVGIAIGLFSIMRTPSSNEPGATPAAVVQAEDKGAPGAIETNRDPTAIPAAYRGDDCRGENCVEKAFVPGRGREDRRRPRDRSLDTKGDKGSTAPVPNDR